MTEMIERVARALCWKNGMNPDLTLGGDGQNFLWMEYEDSARAAILAMREPDDVAIVAAGDAFRKSMRFEPGTTTSPMADAIKAYFDAALGDQTGGGE